MADQPQGASGLDPSVADALKQHLQIAGANAKMGHDAVAATHKVLGKQHSDIMGALSQAMQGGQGGDQGGGDQQSAVWAAFPGTDPQVVSGIPDPDKLHQLFAQDEQKLLSMHQQSQDAWMSQNSAPQGGGEPTPPPGVLGG